MTSIASNRCHGTHNFWKHLNSANYKKLVQSQVLYLSTLWYNLPGTFPEPKIKTCPITIWCLPLWRYNILFINYDISEKKEWVTKNWRFELIFKILISGMRMEEKWSDVAYRCPLISWKWQEFSEHICSSLHRNVRWLLKTALLCRPIFELILGGTHFKER